MKRKVKVPPAARDDAKWNDTRLYITLAVDKWEVYGGVLSQGWAGWGVESAHGICVPFPLLSLLQKVINGNCDCGCNGKLIPKKSSLSG